MNEPPIHYGPDWGRMGIEPPNKFGPLGDPTRWGAVVNTDFGAGIQTTLAQTGQILSAQCRDAYSRAWTLAGTIRAPVGYFNLPDSSGAAADVWNVAAYVTMGVGQIQIVHSFNLRAILLADAPYYWNGDLTNPFTTLPALDTMVTMPFIMPGALVGNSVAIQLLQRLNLSAPFTPIRVTTQLIITPFDPGAK